MATFTVTTTTKVSGAPTVVGDVKLAMAHGATYVLSMATITTETYPQYLDPDGDAVSKFKLLTTNYTNGEFQLAGATLAIGTEVDAADIAAGLLTYVDDGTNTAEHDGEATYTLSDVGSNSFSADSGLIKLGVFADANLAPTEVGDGSETIGFGEDLVFTRAMFTTDTSPAYSDPESDAASLLKIVSLPTSGVLKLNGVLVSANQEIDFANIDSGLLVFTGDISSLSGVTSTFEFQIADVGSGIFVS